LVEHLLQLLVLSLTWRQQRIGCARMRPEPDNDNKRREERPHGSNLPRLPGRVGDWLLSVS
jgi:hypothetical protein